MSVLVNATLCIDDVDVPGVGEVRNVLGGAAAYFSAAARLFGPVRVLAAVGEDYPPALWEQLLGLGIDPAGIARRPGKTFRWHGRYHADLKHRDTLVVDFDPAVEAMPPVPEVWRDTEYVCLGVGVPTNQLALRRSFGNARLTVLDTIDLYVMKHRPALLEAMRNVHGVVINDWEAARLTGEEDAALAAMKLTELGPTFAVVKRGEAGAVLAHPALGRPWACPAYGVGRVVDPTGAGDSFLGGLLGYLASVDAVVDDVDAFRRAVMHGTVAASFTIEAFSLERIAAIDRAAFDRRLSSFDVPA
ncbi:MAG: PfkB family carbohydrate kinase [Planctomycetota bacterium]